MKYYQRKYALILLVLFIVGLYVLHNKAIVPFVMTVVHTRFFTGDPNLGGQATAIRDNMTAMAAIHCKALIKQQLPANRSATFPEYDYKAWNIGFGRYLVHSHIDVETTDGITQRNIIVCKIQYTGGAETDPDNWRLIGIDSNPAGNTGSQEAVSPAGVSMSFLDVCLIGFGIEQPIEGLRINRPHPEQPGGVSILIDQLRRIDDRLIDRHDLASHGTEDIGRCFDRFHDRAGFTRGHAAPDLRQFDINKIPQLLLSMVADPDAHGAVIRQFCPFMGFGVPPIIG